MSALNAAVARVGQVGGVADELADLLRVVPADGLSTFRDLVEAHTRELDRPMGRPPMAWITLEALDAMLAGADADAAMSQAFESFYKENGE